MSSRHQPLVMTAVCLALVALVGALVLGEPAQAQRQIVWKMQSAWPASNLLHISAVELTKSIEQMSGGRLKIEITPAGTIVPPFEVLDATHKGILDAAHAWPGYWAGKNSAAGLYAPGPAGPFGMDRGEYLSWLFAGGGLELYHELLQKELGMNVVAHFTTSLPYWEGFGWMRKPFSSLAELRKLKFRTSGLGLEMMRTMGVTVVTLSGGEVIPALERGVIDGAEWAVPSHDIMMGFQNVVKHYYVPDFRQPTSYQDVLINKKKWEELPADLQAIVKHACLAEMVRMHAVSVDLDSKAVQEMTRQGVKILKTPDDVLKAQLEAIDKVYEAEAKKNPFFAKVLASQREFARRAVSHAQRIQPPLAIVSQHYWGR